MLEAADAYVRLDVFDPDAERSFASGVLCRRHADAMVVPRGWALDDRREATPRLFRPQQVVALPDRGPTRRPPASHPSTVKTSSKAPAVKSTARRDLAVQVIEPALPFGVDPAAAVEAPAEPIVEPDVDADATKVLAWTPEFAAAEDIDVLREARSPLLSRAFRGLRPRNH